MSLSDITATDLDTIFDDAGGLAKTVTHRYGAQEEEIKCIVNDELAINSVGVSSVDTENVDVEDRKFAVTVRKSESENLDYGSRIVLDGTEYFVSGIISEIDSLVVTAVLSQGGVG